MTQETMIQGFEWYLPNTGNHWKDLAAMAPHLADLGINMIWLPPAFKGSRQGDVGYGVYDLFDLGEFDQKGTVRTKYGTKADYLNLIQSLKEVGIKPLADVVLNHKASADEAETFPAVAVDPLDRRKTISQPTEITAWTHFYYPGRHQTYSDFEWHWWHFSGIDRDVKTGRSGIFRILGEGKDWAPDDQVDPENGNYDYLMFADVDVRHPQVASHLHDWMHWFVETTGVAGFRLDAVKHIDASFMAGFIRDAKEQYGDDFYVFGEYWSGELALNERYLRAIDHGFDLIDTRLHLNFHQASVQGEDYDLRHLFEESLVAHHPQEAVTFVENHDTQRGQSLESTVEDWFKPAAYALILLRKDGIPCVFYGDLMGVTGSFPQASFGKEIEILLRLRKELEGAEQVDYLDDPHAIGWVRMQEGRPPLAVVIGNSQPVQTKHMYLGESWAGCLLEDAMEQSTASPQVDPDGWVDLPVPSKALSVWRLVPDVP